MDAVAEQLLEELRAQRAVMKAITAELEQLRAVTAELLRRRTSRAQLPSPADAPPEVRDKVYRAMTKRKATT